MTVLEATRHVGITLGEACCYEKSDAISGPLYEQLRRGYELCSHLDLDELDSIEDWRAEHRTARKRAAHARNLGYRFDEIRREEWNRDLFEINTSLEERQGRPMTESYRQPVDLGPLPEYPCPRHAIRTYGVISDSGKLVAYLWLYRAGELALVSSILGHGDHLRNDVMYLLVEGAIERELEHGGSLVYNRADSGTEGLRYFKARLGFEPARVTWRAFA